MLILKSDKFYIRALQKLNNSFSDISYKYFINYYHDKIPVLNAMYYTVEEILQLLDGLFCYISPREANLLRTQFTEVIAKTAICTVSSLGV